MTYPALFPSFKPLEIGDREFIQPRLWAYQPATSELTFTNLFIWRGHYQLSWCLADDCLVFLSDTPLGPWFFPPIGPSPRAGLCRRLLTWLTETRGASDPYLSRADGRLREELAQGGGFLEEADRDHFDYVYQTAQLISLAGRDYQQKRNHLNKFERSHRHTYEPLTPGHLAACLDLAKKWCKIRRCEEDLNLMEEWEAVKETLIHFQDLGLAGGAVFVEGRLTPRYSPISSGATSMPR